MPLIKIDYSNTIIYKICCKDLSITDIYIGHTTDFRRRKNLHKHCCNNEKDKKYNYRVYQYIRENGGWNNWDMIEIERFEAIDGNDARKKERYYVEDLKATLNMEIPTRTDKEYKIHNAGKIKEQNKQYNIKNAEKIKQYKKEKIICECGCEICKGDIARHKKSKKHQELLN